MGVMHPTCAEGDLEGEEHGLGGHGDVAHVWLRLLLHPLDCMARDSKRKAAECADLADHRSCWVPDAPAGVRSVQLLSA